MSLADCCGCAQRDGDLHSGTIDAAAPFKIGVKAIEMLNQPGKDEENKAVMNPACDATRVRQTVATGDS